MSDQKQVPASSPAAPLGADTAAEPEFTFEQAADAFRRAHVFHRVRVSDFEGELDREEPSLLTGSPSDAEIARDKLSDLARVAVPLMGDQMQYMLTAGQWLIDQHAALTTQLATAEAAKREMKQELADQEVAKFELVKENQDRGRNLYTALTALAGMWNQYCPPPTEKCPYPGHMFMSAGEEAEEVLAAWGLLRANETAIDPDFDHAEIPEQLKQLR